MANGKRKQAKEILRQEQQIEALRLHRAGHTYAEIARRLNISWGAAKSRVLKAQPDINSPIAKGNPVFEDIAYAALDLRKSGKTYRSIAEELDIALGTAHEYVQWALKELDTSVRLEVAEHRRLMQARLDARREELHEIKVRAKKGQNYKEALTALDQIGKVDAQEIDLFNLKVRPDSEHLLQLSAEIWHLMQVLDVTPSALSAAIQTLLERRAGESSTAAD